MNDEQQAAQSIGKFLQLIKGLGELKPGLESLGSVKQAEQEAKSRLSALKIDEAALISKTQSLRVEISGLEKKAELTRDGAKADADSELKRAKIESDNYHTKVIAIVKGVESKSSDKLKALDESITESQAALDEVNAQYKAAKQRLDATNAELDRIVQRAGGLG